MTYTISLVAIAIAAPMISAALLTRNLSVSSDRIRGLLATLVMFQLFELLAVQVLAAFQILGFLKLVNLPKIAALQIVVVVAILAEKSFLPHHQTVRAKGDAMESWIRDLPGFLIVTGILVLGSHLLFAINMLTSYPTGWDGLAYHLPLSLRWLQTGSFDMPASRVWPLSMPGNTEIGMMLWLATGWQSLAVLFNCLSLVVLALAVYVIAHECSRDTIASQVAVLILLTIPLFQFQAYSAYVDLAGTAYLMAAIALFLPRNEARSVAERQRIRPWSIVAISSVACGISIGTKAVFYVYATFFLLIALIALVRTGGYHKRFVVSAMLVMGLSAALPSAFWFWRAFHETSNPIYPLQLSFGGHTIFRGYPSSTITPVDMVRASTVSGWLLYPWTEKISNYDGPLLQYSLDSGVGGAFTTFVPIGLAFCLYLCFKRAANGDTVILLATWILVFGTWWFALRHYPDSAYRYGQ